MYIENIFTKWQKKERQRAVYIIQFNLEYGESRGLEL